MNTTNASFSYGGFSFLVLRFTESVSISYQVRLNLPPSSNRHFSLGFIRVLSMKTNAAKSFVITLAICGPCASRNDSIFLHCLKISNVFSGSNLLNCKRSFAMFCNCIMQSRFRIA